MGLRKESTTPTAQSLTTLQRVILMPQRIAAFIPHQESLSLQQPSGDPYRNLSRQNAEFWIPVTVDTSTKRSFT